MSSTNFYHHILRNILWEMLIKDTRSSSHINNDEYRNNEGLQCV